VVCFGAVLRGAGELRGCESELPSLLKKSPMGLPARANEPVAKNRLVAKIKITLPNRHPIGLPLCTTPRSVQYFLTQWKKPIQQSGLAQSTAFPFPLALARRFKQFQQRRALMNFIVVLGIGSVLGALDGAGIFFAPDEPYKWQIFLAAILKGALVGVLTGFLLSSASRWWTAVGTGAFAGFAFALVVYLAKGGPQSGDAPYVVPSGFMFGGLTGLFVLLWGFRKI
jgi:4-amino-4-deoxy-L-arabinose transferase-like glycosyltransferase